MIAAVLSVLSLHHRFAASGTNPQTLTVAGQTLVAFHDWTFLPGPGFYAGIGNGLLLGYLMSVVARAPRHLAVLGLAVARSRSSPRRAPC